MITCMLAIYNKYYCLWLVKSKRADLFSLIASFRAFTKCVLY